MAGSKYLNALTVETNRVAVVGNKRELSCMPCFYFHLNEQSDSNSYCNIPALSQTCRKTTINQRVDKSGADMTK